jgi:hypothetical protein
MRMARIRCVYWGHLWRANLDTTPRPTTSHSTYIVHLRCARCGLYRKERRSGVPFQPKEQ